MTTHLNAIDETAGHADARPVLRLQGSPNLLPPPSKVADLPGPKAMPLVGNAHQLSPIAMHSTLEGWCREYGPLFRFQLGTTITLCVSDHILIHEILRNRPDNFQRPLRLSHLMVRNNPGLIQSEGDSWRRQRRLTMRALAPDRVKGYFPILRTLTHRLHDRWQRQAAGAQPPDLQRDLKCFSTDVTAWLAMGLDLDSLNNEETPLQHDIDLWFSEVGRMMAPYRRGQKQLDEVAVKEAIARLDQTLVQLVSDARQQALLSAEQPADSDGPRTVLEALVAARNEPDSEFTDEDIQGNLESILIAGEDTTSTALAWLFYFLAQHPDIQQMAREEVDRVLGDEPDDEGPALGRQLIAEFKQLDECVYLDAAITEAMRLKPLAPLLTLVPQVDANFAGLHVPAGQLIFLLFRPSGLTEEHFENAHKYSPERWLEIAEGKVENKVRKIFPFGAGPRLCPGRYLALCELKMVAAMLLRNFEIRIKPDSAPVIEHFTLTMAPDHLPIEMVARRRGR